MTETLEMLGCIPRAPAEPPQNAATPIVSADEKPVGELGELSVSARIDAVREIAVLRVFNKVICSFRRGC